MALTDIEAGRLADNVFNVVGPNKNLIINGAMRVAQRATSVSVSDGSNEGYQSLDRFSFYFTSSAAGEATISQSTTVPSGEGFSNSYKVDVTTANTLSGTQTLLIRHRVEAQDVKNSGWNYTSTSSNITISFWARSTKAGTYCLRLQLPDTTTDKYYIAEYTLSANTWKRIEITVPGHSNAVINNDNGTGLELEWILGSNDTSGTAGSWFDSSARATTNQVNVFDSTDGEFYLTGVQLEVGSVATPFGHRTYGDELVRCERYFEIIRAHGEVCMGYSYNSTNATAPIRFRTVKRDAPGTITLGTAGQTSGTLSFIKADGNYPTTTGSHTVQTITTDGFRVRGSSYVGLITERVSPFYAYDSVIVAKVDAEL